MILIGRKIDDTYLNSNEEEIKKHFQKFKDDWPTHGITLMCDSWTGMTGTSIINFMAVTPRVTASLITFIKVLIENQIHRLAQF
jgi:hypothetical protein